MTKPSFAARLTAALLRLTGFARKRFSGGARFHKILAAVRKLKPRTPGRRAAKRLDIRSETFEGQTVWHIAPRNRAPVARMLFFHGGGYVFPPMSPHFQTWVNLADRHGIAITAPLYPLAPEADAMQATGFALSFYREFSAKHGGAFVMAGDSAGGGLAAATAHGARDQGLPAAAALILVCPWLDVTVSHPDQPMIEKRDSILMITGAREAGQLYARDLATNDRRVSPIFGDWDGLPPILCFSGGDDILLTDARALKALLPSIDYVEGAGLMHDWPIFFFRESREAQARMAEFSIAKLAPA